jgi:lipopolysaccharide export system permease protein
MPRETPVLFGILQRYVIGQVLRSFVLALLTITAVFVLLTVMTVATREGLPPQDILRLIPFVIPGSLPYTIPVAMLFAVSVVYGRLASDNEVIAVKTAGLSAMTVIYPSIWMGLALSVGLYAVSSEAIPRANHYAKLMIFKNLEDMFYKKLKKDGEFDNAHWPFFIRVKDVEEHTLIGVTFMHRSGGSENPNVFDSTIHAQKAWIRFRTDIYEAQVLLEGATVSGGAARPFLFIINNQQMLKYPIPSEARITLDKKYQEMTSDELTKDHESLDRKIRDQVRISVGRAALEMAAGRFQRVDWPAMRTIFGDRARWERQCKEIETEKHLRGAMAWGSLFFVMLGAPVGIFFARRDFLSAFITCFIPIIVVYYPLILGGTNLSKEGIIWPVCVWSGNCVLLVFAVGFFFPRVRRH